MLIKDVIHFAQFYPEWLQFRTTFPRVNRYIVFMRFIQNTKIGPLDKCWEWMGTKDKFGYGRCYWKEKGLQKACAVSYELFKGPIPKKKRIGKKHDRRVICVCHSCDNPSCVNPYHLWLGTDSENQYDMWNKGRHSLPLPGEDHSNAKLTQKDVDDIRRVYKHGNGIDLAKKYKVSSATISLIVHNKHYTDKIQ